MATAAPSHAPSACTAVGHATTSAAPVSASPDSLELSATKVLSLGKTEPGGEESWEQVAGKKGFGESHHTLWRQLLAPSGLGLAFVRPGHHEA